MRVTGALLLALFLVGGAAPGLDVGRCIAFSRQRGEDRIEGALDGTQEAVVLLLFFSLDLPLGVGFLFALDVGIDHGAFPSAVAVAGCARIIPGRLA